MENMKAICLNLRKDILDIVMAGGSGHIGGDMSVVDLLAVLYYQQMNVSSERPEDPDRDRFILSKGHSMEAYYAVLCARGFLNLETVKKEFCRFNTPYIGHPNNKLPGIEMNAGSLGHGLPVCVGMALAGKRDHKNYRIYTVMGDGELAEGSIWEAVMAASHYELDNLCAAVDCNGLQISGSTGEVMSQSHLKERFESFGWKVLTVNGHDPEELNAAFEEAKRVKKRPTVLLAHTVKGYGSAVMENKVSWHHRVPTAAEYEQIAADLAARKEALNHE